MPDSQQDASRPPARHRARRRAVEVLYESDARGRDPRTTLAERLERADPPVSEFAAEIVEGVVAHQEQIDGLLAQYAVGWELDRMPAVDRAILRIGAYELLHADVPDAVVLSEAVGLAEELSTEESPQFVNGLLAKLAAVRTGAQHS
ncbi:NusB antitermination factor [Motilibacter rhizosphaerae]|uniref:Transcription antitermination protein NusB n=1 Tax=Motilibacter rhizosphaerae TaxID=598652 RepID=A0A4Q7NR82_9ACTN|nr:transcription antitermination factor NusB [Motilibacter rhizosphaerae]RZS89404.1 NusB antitermination factor [Motilibacter rhizosphaerae]